MRIAILGDIRANEAALLAVLADLKKHTIDHFWVIGSLLSYGPDPAIVADLAFQLTGRERCLIGHPDWDIVRGGDLATYNAHARNSFRWAHQCIRARWWSKASVKRRWNWLHSGSSHGSDGVWQMFSCTPQYPEADFLPIHVPVERNDQLIPHFGKVTHGAFVGSIGRPGIVFEDSLMWHDACSLNNHVTINGKRFIACPGAVGQPRDGNPHASYAIFDGEAVTWHRVAYEVELTMRRIKDHPELSHYSADRLAVGR